MKLRVRRRASSQVRDGMWTLDDVEAARLEVNALPAMGREAGPSREELWRARTPISLEERALLQATCRENLAQVLAQAGLAGLPLRDHATLPTVERRALVRALSKVVTWSSEGGAFVHPMHAEKRQEFRRGHTFGVACPGANRLLRFFDERLAFCRPGLGSREVALHWKCRI